MKRSLSLLMALIILFVSLPAAKASEVPYSLSPSEFINASVPGARALAYHEGYIYAAQRDPGGIYRISVETGEVTKVLDREYVMTVALNQAGDLFFTTDNYDRNIYKINKSALVNFPLPSNSGTAYYNTGFNFVYGMAFDATDNLYFTDYTSKGIYKLAPGATSATSVIKGLPTAVQGITISSAGHLYAIEDYNNNIYRINSDHLLNSTVAESEFELLLNMRTIPNGIAYLPNGKAYISYGSQVFQSPELGENDTEKPVITLNGASTLLVRNGTSFSDPGVSLSDNVDIDLTAKVTYSLNNVELPAIDTTVAGRYTIRYDATDTAGNEAVAVKRTIIVNEDSTNLAYGVPVTVDKGTASGQTGHLTDDLLETGWIGSQSDAPWTITLDMSAGAAYNEIRVVDTVYLQSYEVKVSDSVTGPFETVTGTTYASLVHTDGQYNGFTTDSVFFPEEISKRYIQIVIYVVGEDGSTGPDLQEIKVFNQPIIPTPTPTPTSTPTATPTPTPTPIPTPTSTPTPIPTPTPITEPTTAPTTEPPTTAPTTAPTAAPTPTPTPAPFFNEKVNIDVVKAIVKKVKSTPALAFKDVSKDSPNAKAIEVATRLGIITGYSDGSFHADAAVTRAEFATMLLKALGLGAKDPSNFKDIKDHWASDAISGLKASSITNGYSDGTFKPNNSISRAEIAAMLAAVINPNLAKETKFKDILGNWAEAEINMLSDMGIVKGTVDGLFKPNANATRSEALLMILRMLNSSLDFSLDIE